QLESAHLAHLGDLERRDTGECRAVERPASGVWLVETGQQVEQGRFTGTVRPDQRRDGVSRDLQVVDIDGLEPAERTRDVVRDDDRVNLCHTWGGLTDVKPGRLDSRVIGH